MTVYIAAPFPEREAAQALMSAVEMSGHDVTSTWLREEDTLADQFARLDLADVARSDVLVAFNPPSYANSGTGGRHVELGYALALGKVVVLLGDRTNLFHYLDEIKVVGTTQELLETLAAIATRNPLTPGPTQPAYTGTAQPQGDGHP